MRDRRLVLLIGLIYLAIGWTFRELGSNNSVAYAQQPTAADAADVPLIRAETRLVLVDTVVTDKSGKYIRDLTAKNFKVFEDNKEQPIKSFSLEDDAASSGRPRPGTWSFSLTTRQWTSRTR